MNYFQDKWQNNNSKDQVQGLDQRREDQTLVVEAVEIEVLARLNCLKSSKAVLNQEQSLIVIMQDFRMIN